MSFYDLAALMQASLYQEMGLPAYWAPAGGPVPATPNVTVLLATPPAADDAGGLWQERPKRTPGRMVRIRTSDLTAIGAMALDVSTRAPAPVWNGVTVNFDGVARTIQDKPEPADDLARLEWVFNLT